MTKPAPDAARVIAVNRFYWPDHSATSQILTDLVAHLADERQAVTVITSRRRQGAPPARHWALSRVGSVRPGAAG